MLKVFFFSDSLITNLPLSKKERLEDSSCEWADTAPQKSKRNSILPPSCLQYQLDRAHSLTGKSDSAPPSVYTGRPRFQRASRRSLLSEDSPCKSMEHPHTRTGQHIKENVESKDQGRGLETVLGGPLQGDKHKDRKFCASHDVCVTSLWQLRETHAADLTAATKRRKILLPCVSRERNQPGPQCAL